MGAWGTAAFDNDDASDWVYDFEKRGMDAVESALSDALGSNDLAMPTDVNAIAGDDAEWRRSVDDLIGRLTA
jgi:hypothetical protein